MKYKEKTKPRILILTKAIWPFDHGTKLVAASIVS